MQGLYYFSNKMETGKHFFSSSKSKSAKQLRWMPFLTHGNECFFSLSLSLFPAAITAESHQQSGLRLVGSVSHCGARGAGCHQQVGCALLLVNLAWKYLDIVQLLRHIALRFQDKPPSKLLKKPHRDQGLYVT